MAENDIIIVGDSRINGFYPRGSVFKDKKIKVVTRSGARLDDLMKLMEQKESLKNGGLVVVIGFFCDFTYLSVLANGMYKGLCKARNELDYSNLVLNVTYWTRRLEREMKVRVIWTIPYIPNILQYNQTRVSKYKLEPLNRRESRECIESSIIVNRHCDELQRRLSNAAVRTVDLRNKRCVDLAIQNAYDGLHLVGEWKQCAFEEIVVDAMELSSRNVVEPNHVIRDKLLTPLRRKYNRNKRKRNRLNRKLRNEDVKSVASAIINKHTKQELREFLQ